MVDVEGVLPHLEMLARAPVEFAMHFGLDVLPDIPGILMIRGARQYGKSTWMEGQIRKTVQEFGPGSALYLNGDEIATAPDLAVRIRELVPLFGSSCPVRRLFIDEITAIKDWERGLKQVVDAGELSSVLVITTGSRATDLRRGEERLPGRKGRLERTSYIFTALPYSEFSRVAGEELGDWKPWAYLLGGGCPAALAEIISEGALAEYIVTMIRDWMMGEVVASGRDRASLLSVMQTMLARGASPLGQARLAREAGLANNTVAAGYVEALSDLLCVASSHAWDPSRKVVIRRKPAKYHLINTLAAVAWSPDRLRSPAEFEFLDPGVQGTWIEWLVAQEIFRRRAVIGDQLPEMMSHWQGGGHELDFVIDEERFIEVKRGSCSPMDFSWFPRTFPRAKLLVIGQGRFEAGPVRGITLEEYLLGEGFPDVGRDG